jgi:hypothetical protein
MLWQDKTYLSVPPVLSELATSRPVINIRCTDISKENVEVAFVKTFGYNSLVDPTTFRGLCIKKPNENAVGYGFVVECPTQRREQEFVYQKLIDARPDAHQREYRTPVILGEIPLVYVSRRDFPSSDLRDCQRHLLTPTPTADIYSQDEIEKLLAFSGEIGMDIGELDILRDKNDGRLYILDANKTPTGFGLLNRAGWSPGDCKRTTVVLAESFERGLTRILHEGGQ